MADLIAVILVLGLFALTAWADRNNDAARREADNYFAEMERRASK